MNWSWRTDPYIQEKPSSNFPTITSLLVINRKDLCPRAVAKYATTTPAIPIRANSKMVTLTVKVTSASSTTRQWKVHSNPGQPMAFVKFAKQQTIFMGVKCWMIFSMVTGKKLCRMGQVIGVCLVKAKRDPMVWLCFMMAICIREMYWQMLYMATEEWFIKSKGSTWASLNRIRCMVREYSSGRTAGCTLDPIKTMKNTEMRGCTDLWVVKFCLEAGNKVSSVVKGIVWRRWAIVIVIVVIN